MPIAYINYFHDTYFGKRARVKAGDHPLVPITLDEVLTMIPLEKKQ